MLLETHTHRPVDVIPDRTSDTLTAWLREHPGVQIICRQADGAARRTRQGLGHRPVAPAQDPQPTPS
ncbi:hypothetical protein OHB44_09710 [Micromonospora sp. NBC_00821]|nr:hypothetical protein OHB44_09710 [Micromonospora sp. NBC_00821]